ncbi:patatin-like phospholipase family protein [Mesorhizobium newzealandense]|uniref:Patatin-like phospholipase family protein n=1 Tax=Mesorhizobium newzealandense TaxID=1300302 RepID=A0ABW4UEN6_9HYPH
MRPHARPADIQSLFAANADTKDFVQARKLEDAYEDTIGLCLSGGGYRAMIYHVGALIRLNELGFLPRLGEIASVSGGSITAGVLALAWPRLIFDNAGTATNLGDLVARPLLIAGDHRFPAIHLYGYQLADWQRLAVWQGLCS